MPDNPSWKIFATGLRAPEGPTFDRDGNLYVVEMAVGRIARIDPTGRVSIFTEDGGGPNGMALGADGCLYVCNNGGYSVPQEQRQSPRIERISPAGEVHWLVAEIDGTPVNAVNDITFDQHGNYYCTDPQFPAEGTLYSHVCPPAGVIFGDRDGAVRRLELGIRFPNGIAITPDARTLVVAETQTRQIHAFEILEPGVLGPARIYAELPSGMPDGMCFDSEGYLLVCGFGAGVVHVFAPGGKGLTETLSFEDANVTNLCFGGAELKTLYVTEMTLGRVVTVPWSRPGMQLFPYR
jgi:gluconolactonase